MKYTITCTSCRLAHLVGYVSTGTVEYLYSEKTNTFSFLELNPRLQVRDNMGWLYALFHFYLTLFAMMSIFEINKFYLWNTVPKPVFHQVEHPCTEMISGVNLPAAQLQIAMGIPLNRIADIRALYGKVRERDEIWCRIQSFISIIVIIIRSYSVILSAF